MSPSGYAVPHSQREQFVELDRFAIRLKRHGWGLLESQPIYTDPQTIRQPWLLSSTMERYTDRTFYHLFDASPFRTLLRLLLISPSSCLEQFQAVCPDRQQLTEYIDFLHDQDMLLFARKRYIRGPALRELKDIGHTFEWWCAEWLRRFYASTGQGLVPVRHGVRIREFLHIGDPGDLDVIALPNKQLLFLECKTSTLQLQGPDLDMFLWRADFLRADLALFFVDPSPLHGMKGLKRLHNLLIQWRFAPIHDPQISGAYRHQGYATGVDSPPVGDVCQYYGRPFYAVLADPQQTLSFTFEKIMDLFQYSKNL